MTTSVVTLSQPPVTIAAKKKRVLLLDTSQTKRDLRADVMRKLGIDVDCAADVLEAHARIVAVDIHRAAYILDVKISEPSVRFDGRPHWHRDLQIGIHPGAVAHAVLIGAHDDLIALLD